MDSPQSRMKDQHEVVNLQLEKIIDDLKSDQLDLDILDEIEHDLKDHIFLEETSIFPAVRDKGNLNLEISGMETEHAAVWRLFMLIQEQIDRKNYSKIPKYLDEIRLILLDHNRREELVLYPLMNEDMMENAKRPENWVCNKIKKYPNQK